MALNISHNGKQITKINGKDVYAVAKPIANGIDWGVNHGFDLFSDILSRPLIKVYGEEPASWSWAMRPSNGTKYVDILRSMEWQVEGRRFITTDYVHQGEAGSQERFVVLEEKGVGGTYGLYSANPGALDRGFPRDNEIYFIKGSPHGGGGYVIKKINSGTGTFPEFNVSGGGIDWEFVPVTSFNLIAVPWYSNGFKITFKYSITYSDGNVVNSGEIVFNSPGERHNTDYSNQSQNFNLNGIAPNNSQLVIASTVPGTTIGHELKFDWVIQWGNNGDYRWSSRGFSTGESFANLDYSDPYTNWISYGGTNYAEPFRYQIDRRTDLNNWFKQFGYWKKKSF